VKLKNLLLEAVASERLVMTQQAEKGLAGAVVNCKVWKLAVALQLLVVTSCVYKWSINPITIPKPRRQALILRDNTYGK
jgi:hypothetical protein